MSLPSLSGSALAVVDLKLSAFLLTDWSDWLTSWDVQTSVGDGGRAPGWGAVLSGTTDVELQTGSALVTPQVWFISTVIPVLNTNKSFFLEQPDLKLIRFHYLSINTCRMGHDGVVRCNGYIWSCDERAKALLLIFRIWYGIHGNLFLNPSSLCAWQWRRWNILTVNLTVNFDLKCFN